MRAHVGAADPDDDGRSVHVEGLEHVAAERSYVFVSNHQSHYDTAVLFATLPHQLRIIAKESLGTISVRRLAPASDRAHPGRSPPAGSVGDLRVGRPPARARGLSLIVYPEGTRSPDGRVQRFKPGSFQIALQSGLPVVPMSIVGTRQVMRKGDLAARPAPCAWCCTRRSRRADSPEGDPREFGERVRQIIAPAVEGTGMVTTSTGGSERSEPTSAKAAVGKRSEDAFQHRT